MSLAYEALRYVDRALKDPAWAGDPNALRRLANYAKEAFEGIVALHAPVSPMSWELNTFLDGAAPASQRNSFKFPRPVEVIGFFSSLVVSPAEDQEGFLTPSLDVIAVQIDSDNQAYLTSADGISTIAGGKAGTFVTLAAMDVQVPRLVGYKLRNPSPVLGFTYRWKIDPTFTDEAQVYKSCMVSTCVYARYI